MVVVLGPLYLTFYNFVGEVCESAFIENLLLTCLVGEKDGNGRH